MAFGNVFGQGGSSLISRLLGRQHYEAVKRVSSFCFYIALVTGIALALLMSMFNQPLLTLLGAVKETMPYTFLYVVSLRFIAWLDAGLVFVCARIYERFCK